MESRVEIINQMLKIVKTGDVDEVITFFKAGDNAQYLNVPVTENGFPILHIAAVLRPEMMEVLLSLGADINKKDNEGRTVFQYLIDTTDKLTTEIGYMLIQHGADPNTYGLVVKKTFLQIILDNAISKDADQLIYDYFPGLLKAGANADVSKEQANLALYGLLSGDATFDTILAALTFIEAGADPGIYNKKKRQHVIDCIYKLCPEVREYVKARCLVENVYDPRTIFQTVSVLEIATKVRNIKIRQETINDYLNLLLYLSVERASDNASSMLARLPREILLHVLSFLDFEIMEKTEKEGIALAKKILEEPAFIKEFAKKAGGINVLQKKGLSFTFFKSICEKDKKRLENPLSQEGKWGVFKFIRKCIP